jgi:hypothetical protein
VFAFTAGELLGFGGIAVGGGALIFWLTLELDEGVLAVVFYAVAVIGGLGEGMVLGWFQARVLREVVSGFDARRWILVTSLAAAFAWALGMLAPTLDDLVGLSMSEQLIVWVPGSVLILFSLGTAQALALRGLVRNPLQWILANAVGWLLGLPWTFVLPALLPESAPVAAWGGVFVVAGALMGATVGAVTGWSVLRMQTEMPSYPEGRPRSGS